jgi:hypothetical protein
MAAKPPRLDWEGCYNPPMEFAAIAVDIRTTSGDKLESVAFFRL